MSVQRSQIRNESQERIHCQYVIIQGRLIKKKKKKKKKKSSGTVYSLWRKFGECSKYDLHRITNKLIFCHLHDLHTSTTNTKWMKYKNKNMFQTDRNLPCEFLFYVLTTTTQTKPDTKQTLDNYIHKENNAYIKTIYCLLHPLTKTTKCNRIF